MYKIISISNLIFLKIEGFSLNFFSYYIIFLCFFLLGIQNLVSQEKLSNNRNNLDAYYKEIYKERRNKIISNLSKNKILIIYNFGELTDNQKLYFGMPKNIFMLYLIGKNIDNSILILHQDGIKINGEKYHELLFLYEQNSFEKVWDEPQICIYEIEQNLGIEKAMNISYFDYYIDPVLKNCDTLYLLPSNFIPTNLLSKNLIQTESFEQCLFNIYFTKLSNFLQKYKIKVLFDYDYLNSMREIKDSLEISFIQKAVDITIKGHLESMKRIEPNMTENQLKAIMEGTFGFYGASGAAYKSIIASGKNAHILHRHSNFDTLKSGELVLMDCGAEYKGYCADITRTIPVNGKFSEEQRIIYNVVIEAQDSAIAACREGKLFMLPHKKATQVIKKRLKELEIIKEENESTRYFYHGTSHYIGLETHDVGKQNKLKSGNVITIEPGIYIPKGSPCDSRWWNICIRIEDDILITNDEPIILSNKLPRKIEEIEIIMNTKEKK